ncbi:hypothetical protein [Melioribacter sp. OK-6-Me]|uniref:hypothetical protein n=1 Tax=unclassified Melioribacter TaxID=2627329 RepID=UPI003ED896F3
MGNSSTLLAARLSEKLQIRETLAIFVLAVILPIVFHLLPDINGIPLGKYVLPVYYAPLIAVLYFRFHVAFAASLLAPVTNYLITGKPAFEIVQLITLELVIFVTAAYLLKHVSRFKYVIAPLSYFISVMFVYFFAFLNISGLQLSNGYLFNSFSTAIPGIVMLTILNIILIKRKEA